MKYSALFSSMILLFIVSCSKSLKKDSYKETMSVVNEYSKKIEKHEGIRRSGYGLYYLGKDNTYDGKIRAISLGYRVDKNMKYDEARKYFYFVVDGLVDQINKNKQLSEYFPHFPIDYSDLNLYLSFEDKKEGALKRDDVRLIHMSENEIFYLVTTEGKPDTKKHPDGLIQMLEENHSVRRTIQEDLALHSK